MKIIKFTSLLVLALISLQCVSSKKSVSTKKDSRPEAVLFDPKLSGSDKQAKKMASKGFTKGVIVDKRGLSGCSFLIQASESIIFEPIKLEEKFKKDGLEVYIKFKKSRKATTCMNGQPIIISEIHLAK
jgi:hypothetical protein